MNCRNFLQSAFLVGGVYTYLRCIIMPNEKVKEPERKNVIDIVESSSENNGYDCHYPVNDTDRINIKRTNF